MAISYRIQYKIVEGAKLYSGTRIVEVPLDQYIEFVRKTYPEASTVYLELVEEIESNDELDYSSGESIIILPYAYDSLLP